MDGRITSYLFLLVIIFDYVQAFPKINLEAQERDLNNKINKKLLQKTLKYSNNARKQKIEKNSRIRDDYADDDGFNLGDFDNTSDPIDYGLPSIEELRLDDINTRPFQVGDMMTPKSLFSLAWRLFNAVTKGVIIGGKGKEANKGSIPKEIKEKVETVDEEIAKGVEIAEKALTNGAIISGAKDAVDLAEKLFPQLFDSDNNAAIVKEEDIDTLDALQALSLNGEVVNLLRSPSDSYTESPIQSARGGLKRCHYKVLRVLIPKPKTKNNKKNSKRRRQGTARALKNLDRKRKLVINPARRRLKNKTEPITVKKEMKPKENETEPICRWKYYCTDEQSLRSCRLHPLCSNQTEYNDFFVQQNKDFETYRKAGHKLQPIDKEVNRILFIHKGNARKLSLLNHELLRNRNTKLESLKEYFNKISGFADYQQLPPVQQSYTQEPDQEKNAESGQPDEDHNPESGQADGDDYQEPMENLDLPIHDSVKDNYDEETRRLLNLIPVKPKRTTLSTQG